MKEVRSNPQGKEIRVPMTDPRWPKEDGWVKMAHNVNGVEIHYVKNTKMENLMILNLKIKNK
ncbi:hypothetical protein [Bacillus sp. SH8-8]|uniref:hypothetical protein n=1 Tax=Bacillus sp. SH8-8 TaxID=2217830 RepID=UPI0034D54562